MKEWLTAKEIAEYSLPSLPATERAVQLLAKRSRWDIHRTPSGHDAVRKREGRGGGSEYHVSLLPDDARTALMRHALRRSGDLVIATETGQTVALTQTEAQLKKWQRDTMHARLALLREVERLTVINGVMAAREMVARAAAEGGLRPELQAVAPVANARRKGDGLLSARVLRKWAAAYDAEGAIALAPKGPANESFAPPVWMADFLDFYALASMPSVSQAYEHLLAEMPHVDLPSLRTVQREIEKMPALEKNRGRMGPRKLRQYKAFIRRDTSELWPTAVYVADGHTFKALTAHPLTGKSFKPEITSMIDVVTRRNVGWSVALAENTWGTIDALRHAFMTSGICDIYYVDNGQGFNNAVLDDPLTGLFSRFDVTKSNSIPWNSQARGVVERSHQSIWIRDAKWLSTFDRPHVDQQAREATADRIDREIAETGMSRELMSWPAFIEWCTGAVAAYNGRPHSSLPKIRDGERLRHMSPDECWASWVAKGWTPDRVVDAGEADMHFRPQIQRKVRRCEVNLFGNIYFSNDLEAWHDRDVLVAYDIHDANIVWVMTTDHQYICEAKWGANAVSYFPKSFAEQAHETRVKGQRKRVQSRLDKIDETATWQIEARADAPIIPLAHAPFIKPMPEPAPVAQAHIDAPASIAAPIPGARPSFASDAAYAAWLLAHPGEMTAHDVTHLKSCLRRGSTRKLFEFEGIDVVALDLMIADPERISA